MSRFVASGRPRRRRAGNRFVASVLIGTGLLLAQRTIAQSTEGLVSLPVDDARFVAQFNELLVEPRSRSLADGFRLAQGLGPVAAPLLWNMLGAAKSNARRRITILAAAILAEGSLGDERVLANLERDKTELQDRLMTCFLLALGPTRQRQQPQFWPRVLGKNKTEPVALLQVAALLASARFPGAAAAAPPAALRDGDPGVIAAALFAGVAMPESLVQPFWRKTPPDHAQLVWRGAYLGSLLRPDPEIAAEQLLVQRARETVQMTGEVRAGARDAAALLLGRARAFDRDVRPDWRPLTLLLADAGAAATVPTWLAAAPQLLAEGYRSRLAVEYVMSRSVDAVLEDRASWRDATGIRAHVAIALAWRLCGSDEPHPIDWAIADLPEWYLVRWASGAHAAKESVIGDPVLEQAAALAQDGRLPRDAARRLFEEALWRSGSHPGLGQWQAQREFVRDLMLSGSVPGNRYRVGLQDYQRYVPGGLRHEDDLFDIAIEAYEYLNQPAPPVPDECRLR